MGERVSREDAEDIWGEAFGEREPLRPTKRLLIIPTARGSGSLVTSMLHWEHACAWRPINLGGSPASFIILLCQRNGRAAPTCTASAPRRQKTARLRRYILRQRRCVHCQKQRSRCVCCRLVLPSGRWLSCATAGAHGPHILPDWAHPYQHPSKTETRTSPRTAAHRD